jgi:outer membrane protein TolC
VLSILAAGFAPATFAASAYGAGESAPAAGNPAPVAADPTPLIEPATPGGLTSDQVAARVIATSPGLRADREESNARAFALAQARASFVPRLSTGLRYARQSRESSPALGNLVAASPDVPAGATPDPAQLVALPLSFPTLVNHYEAQASLDVPLSDYALRLPQLYEAAQKDARAAELLLAAHRLQAASEARVAYYDWVKARLQHRVAERTLERTRLHLSDAQTALALGTASQADVLSVEAQLANAELALARALSATEIQGRRLGVLMHDAAPVAYEIGEDLTGPDSATPAPSPDRERLLLERALERRLELRVLSENAAGQRQRARAALAAELPRLSASGSASYARPNSRVIPPTDEFHGSWEVGVALSWSPTDLLGSDAGRQATLARARQLDAQGDELVDSIALEVKSALSSRSESEVRVKTSERALTASAESHRVRRELFKNGRATSTELSDAETEWSQAQLDVVAARVDRRIAQVKLAHALGEDVEAPAGSETP